MTESLILFFVNIVWYFSKDMGGYSPFLDMTIFYTSTLCLHGNPLVSAVIRHLLLPGEVFQ